MNSQRHARAFPISHVRVMFKFEVNDKYSLTNHLPCSQPPPIYYPFLYMYIYFLCFTNVGCRRHCHSATAITQLLYMIIIIISSTLLSSLYHYQTIRFNNYLSPTPPPPIWSPLSLFKKREDNVQLYISRIYSRLSTYIKISSGLSQNIKLEVI